MTRISFINIACFIKAEQLQVIHNDETLSKDITHSLLKSEILDRIAIFNRANEEQ